MNPFSVTLIIVSTFNIVLGLIIHLRKYKDWRNISFAVFSYSIALWGIGLAFFLNSNDTDDLIFWAKVYYNAPLYIAYSILQFSLHFPREKRVHRNKAFILFIPCLILSLLISFVDSYQIREVIQNSWGNEVILGKPEYAIYSTYFVTYFFGALYIIFKKYQKARRNDSLQLLYVLISVFFAGTFGVFFNLFLPWIGNYKLIWVGPQFTIIIVGTMFYSMIKHRFLGIRFIIGKVFYYIFISLIGVTLYYIVVWLQTQTWEDIFSPQAVIASVGAALIGIPLFSRLSEFIKDISEDFFIYSEYDPYQVINKLLRKTSTELDVEKVSANVLSISKKALNLEKIGIVIFNKNNNKVIYKRLSGFDRHAQRNMRELLEVVHLWDYQEKNGKTSEILVYEELISKHQVRKEEEMKRLLTILKFMKEEEIAVLLPLNRKVQLNGLMLVGYKEDDDAFTVGDIDLLESIIANASVAVGRALLYQEVKEFAHDLEIKVDEATADLQNKIKMLEDARRRESDMIDILGHELRTPMSIIKSGFGFLKLLITGKTSIKDEQQKKVKQREYTDRIEENIEREIKLIDNLLGSTKIDKGKLELAKEAVDMIDVIEDGIVGQNKFAKRKGLYLKFNKPENADSYPSAFADRARTQEIMDNLISNAVKYTEDGGVTIDISQNDEFIQVDVSDTGIGIPEEAMKDLGKKFFRVNQYTKQTQQNTNAKIDMVRPGGTGLGLYVTFGLVKAQGGEIWAESEVGKGTIFHFTIPKLKDEHKPHLPQDENDEKDVFKRLGLK